MSDSDLASHIGTQQVDHFCIGSNCLVRIPWAEPQYFDDTTFRRDLDRIERFYQAHGYYSGSVSNVDIQPNASGHEVDVNVTVREGDPTTVANVWISGCEPESITGTERWRVSASVCNRMRSQLRLQPGAVFTELDYDGDQQLIANILRDEGRAAVTVSRQATVDPVLHRAYVSFVLQPGPPARFGQVYMHEGTDAPAQQTGRLGETQYPAAVAIRATGIRAGSQYSQTALADAQRRLLGIGVFAIVRIDEEKHECDSHDRCDAARDSDDPREYVRVDVQVHVSPTRIYRLRGGLGLEADQTRSDFHLSASYQHHRVPFAGRIGQYTVEERPLVFLPFSFSGGSSQTFGVTSIGNSLYQEFRLPELWPGGTLLTDLLVDFGPDPINPSITHTFIARPSVGTLFRFSRHWYGAASIRGSFRRYYATDPSVAYDPIYRQQYPESNYEGATYLEQRMTYDGRDNPLQPRRGFFASVLTQEGLAVPPASEYTFLRGVLDVRGYYPLGSHFVIAARASIGAATGVPGPNQWPVPYDLRFFSGGDFNRGYGFNQVGWLTTVPQSTEPGGDKIVTTLHTEQTPQGTPVVRPVAIPDDQRYISVGGLAEWEASVELRFYAPPYGAVLFFDSSDVTGWAPSIAGTGRPAMVDPNNPMLAAIAPPNQGLFSSFDPHPSAGFGLRYISPVGVIRVDLGMRLDEAGCIGGRRDSATGAAGTDSGSHNFQTDINTANTTAANSGQYPSYYAVSRPRCDFFGTELPFALHLSIGEAF